MIDYAKFERHKFLSAPGALGRMVMKLGLRILQFEVDVHDGKLHRIEYEKAQLDLERGVVLADRARLIDQLQALRKRL